MVISYALMLSVVLSGFSIKYNYNAAGFMARFLRRDFRVIKEHSEDEGEGRPADIMMLGYFINAEAFALELKQRAPELVRRIQVIDFNLQNHPKIREHGFGVSYGDVGNPETLRHYGISDAKIILLTIPNAFLRGITNEGLLGEIRKINPKARIITVSDSEADTARMMGLGAFRVVSPPVLAAPMFVESIKEAMSAASSSEG